MANQISMTPQEMTKAASKASRTADTLQNNVIDEMEKLLKTLETSWKGEAIDGYKARYKQIKKALDGGVALLHEIEKNLETSRDIIEETDRTISKKFKNLGN